MSLLSPDALGEIAEPEDFPATSELECVRIGPLPWTRALSQGLGELGVPHRVERDTRSEEEGGVHPLRFDGETVYGTWVKPEDAQAAREVDRALFGHLDADRQEEALGDEACPACQEPLAQDAVECPSCGLSFA